MKKLMVVLVTVILTMSAVTTYADTIGLSENWYIKITNFSLQGEIEPDWSNPNPTPINQIGFSRVWSAQQSTTSLVGPILQNVSSDGNWYSTLIFDFHAGQVNLNDYVWFYPFATLGSTWNATMSFDWEIHCNDPRVVLGVDCVTSPSGQSTVWWNVPAGSSYKTGSASLDVKTYVDNPKLYVSFASVPEPTSLLAITMLTLGFVCQRRRTH
jgi:hypothetical protein